MPRSTLAATIATAAFVCAFATGCTVTTSGTSTSDGGTGAAAPGSPASPDGGAAAAPGAAGANALGCPAILDCASKCKEGDTACENTCVDQGSPAGKDAINGLVACMQTNSCDDSQCYQDNCSKELQACVDSASSGGQAFEGTAPTGNVPADVIGKWTNSDELYDFKADGTVSRLTRAKVGSCTTEKLENGTVVASGTTLTIYFTSSISKVCNTTSNPGYAANSQAFTYLVEDTNVGPKLRLTEQMCRYSDPKAAAFYCVTGYDKI